MFLNELALVVKEKRLGPEEVLLKEKTFNDKIYFVMKGKGIIFFFLLTVI
jgi:hypothetical protein